VLQHEQRVRVTWPKSQGFHGLPQLFFMVAGIAIQPHLH
jgi:hypothetical protein